MASLVFLRSCGVGAILAGILFAMWGYLDGSGTAAYPVETTTTALSVLVPVLFLLGVAGLLTQFKGLVSPLGYIGFVIAFIGSAAGVVHGFEHAISWYETYVMGYARATASGRLLPFLYGWLAWLFAGLLVVGIAAFRTQALGVLRALPLAMGALGSAYHFTDSGGAVEARLSHIGFGVLFSLSWVVLGGVLWQQEERRSTEVSESAVKGFFGGTKSPP